MTLESNEFRWHCIQLMFGHLTPFIHYIHHSSIWIEQLHQTFQTICSFISTANGRSDQIQEPDTFFQAYIIIMQRWTHFHHLLKLHSWLLLCWLKDGKDDECICCNLCSLLCCNDERWSSPFQGWPCHLQQSRKQMLSQVLNLPISMPKNSPQRSHC